MGEPSLAPLTVRVAPPSWKSVSWTQSRRMLAVSLCATAAGTWSSSSGWLARRHRLAAV